MTIMFAGGMTLAIPSMMPGAVADFSSTDGYLTVSSTSIQGGAILEVVINDPTYSATDTDIGGGPDVTFQGVDYIATQAVDGKWYAYFVDYSSSNNLDDTSGTGLEYGRDCAGLGTNGTASGPGGGSNYDIVSSTVTVWAEAYSVAGGADGPGGIQTGEGDAGDCNNIDGAGASYDGLASTATSGATPRPLLTSTVLTNAPAMSQWDTSTGLDGGQRLHVLNDTSGHGSWPFIFADSEFTSTNIVEYKPSGDAIEVSFGNTDGDTSISLGNASPSEFHEIHLSIVDPALNIDPTGPDVWQFDLTDTDNEALRFITNGSNTDHLQDSEALLNGCVDNCTLATGDLDGDGSSDTSVLTASQYLYLNMTESSANSATFESWDLTGDSGLDVAEGAAGDTTTSFTYGGNSVLMVITYNDASMTFETAGGGDWRPGETATMTIVDPDLNKNPTSADELLVSDETAKVPTIKVGSPLTIMTGTTDGEQICSSIAFGCIGWTMGNDQCGVCYTGIARDTYDHSERMRVTLDGETDDTTAAGYGVTTWLNVTTTHTVQELTNLAGTVILSYDITGLTDELTDVSAVSVYMTGSGSNSTNKTDGTIVLASSGASSKGALNLCGEAVAADPALCSEDIHGHLTLWEPNNDSLAANVGIAFKVTHASTGAASNTADFAFAADICNFDQDNGTDTHNCIYRIEAEETGNNTGVFVGTAEYIQLNNSTAYDNRTTRGVHDGNDLNVAGLITGNSDAVTIVLMDAVDGTSSIRVSHNDTDALGGATEVQKQLDAFTHTGTVSLDANAYADGDMATITITDLDLNQDSGDRETYQNSSGTFQITCTDGTNPEIASKCVTTAQVIIETGADTGVFVGTFTVPTELGEDMEITYYESADAAGEAIEFYDTATISSSDGDVALNKSVYPVPFTVNDLYDGSDTADTQDHSGNVTATIIVTEPDNTADTLTVATVNDIAVKLIHGSTTTELFNAGLAGGSSSTVSSSVAVQLGPLTETERGSTVYEVDMTIQALMCGPDLDSAGADSGTMTCQQIKSGDVLQVLYKDTADGAGATSTFYDSSTFDLRNASISTDKDVYVIGSDMVVTLTDPDLNVDGASIQTYSLNLIEWDSDADGSELLNQTDDFTANPSKLQETGSDTGVFQTVITIPTQIVDTTTTSIDFGEAVTLTYVDTGVAGEDDYLGDSADVETTFSISNFGALIELDKAVYGWKDAVGITITAPDWNQNSAAEETIGTSSLAIQVTTRNGKMCSGSTYKAVETDEDTGVFTAEVTLAGFSHTMSSDSVATTPTTATCGTGDTDGVAQTAGQTDGVSVSFEYNDGSVVVASAGIQWVIGEASWDTSSVSAGGSAVISVTDNDENLDSTITDTFKVAVFSDSDTGGFNVTLSETDEDTGVFEATVYFTSDLATSGTTLRVAEGDTVTAEFVDETLPEPYTSSDDLTIAATTTVGTAFPPLERAPAANARVVDAFGASVASVSVDQQVQIAADVSNGQSGDQGFAYIVQVQDGDGVTVSLAWITGSLTAGQSMSPALSWTPTASGSYTATVFVWESVDNPTALSPTVSVDISVN